MSTHKQLNIALNSGNTIFGEEGAWVLNYDYDNLERWLATGKRNTFVLEVETFGGQAQRVILVRGQVAVVNSVDAQEEDR